MVYRLNASHLFLLACLALAFSLSIVPSLNAIAAVTGDVDSQTNDQGNADFAREIVSDIQHYLNELGLYTGAIDGRFDANVDAAIRAYQGQSGLSVTGRPSVKLRDHLKRTLDVRALMRRLETTREKGEDAAREALLAHPATRDLVTGLGNVEAADPTRDTASCFAEPTVRCLLNEAFESAKAIHKQEHRDWALGEILTTQAQAGLSEAALETTRRITDPRLIIVALREIAEAAALRGRDNDAFDGIQMIPDLEAQADAWAAVAQIQANQGRLAAAADSLRMIETISGDMDDPIKRAGLLSTQAVLFYKMRDDDAAASRIKTLETMLQNDLNTLGRKTLVRLLAKALSATGKPEQSLTWLSELGDGTDHSTVLMAAATAQARLGLAQDARETLNAIRSTRYRTLAQINVAHIHAVQGNHEEAEILLDTAEQEVAQIQLPYAKAYSKSRLALTFAAVAPALPHGSAGAFYEKAVTHAGEIDDPRIRARTLWEIDNRSPLSKPERPNRAELRIAAETAANEITSVYSRVWVFGEVAADRARQGDNQGAETAFGRGFELAKVVENAWTRARVLTKMAATLMNIASPTPKASTWEPAQP